jgi:Tfp pilus assembly protein PilX
VSAQSSGFEIVLRTLREAVAGLATKEVQMKSLSIIRNSEGAALVLALLVMAAASVIGVMAVTTSSIEMKISGNERIAKETFYAAEAGIEHIRGLLKSEFAVANAARMAAKQSPDWDFALLGPNYKSNPTPATDTTYTGGTTWINNATFGSHTYSVRVWNNLDGGTALNDFDKIIYAQADASRPGGGSRSIQVTLEGGVFGESTTFSYTAQAGGGVGKNYNADDINAISVFNVQMVGVK